MQNTKNFYFEDDIINPFEVKDNSKLLRNSLNEIDRRSLRTRFKNTDDPINLAFESINETSLSTLTKDFIEESFSDFMSFISKFCG